MNISTVSHHFSMIFFSSVKKQKINISQGETWRLLSISQPGRKSVKWLITSSLKVNKLALKFLFTYDFLQKMSQRNVLGWALRGASCGTIVLSPNPCVHPSVSTGITCVFSRSQSSFPQSTSFFQFHRVLTNVNTW